MVVFGLVCRACLGLEEVGFLPLVCTSDAGVLGVGSHCRPIRWLTATGEISHDRSSNEAGRTLERMWSFAKVRIQIMRTGTSLESAALSGDAEIVKLLLDHCANPDGGASSTPLYRASQKGHLEVIELLLAKEADPTIATTDGIAPLHEAARIGHLEIAQRLVDHGADVNALTDFGKPSIHFAVLHGHTDVAVYLREMGAAPGEIAPISELLVSADLAEGELEAEVCTRCHKLEKGKNYYSPSLWNAVGRPRGSVSDFAYSQAFSTLDGDWTFDALNEFLARPTEVIPGNKMNVRGMVDPQKRANLIAFLRTLSDNPVPLPTP